MRYVLTNGEMREADLHTIEEQGMPANVLMGGAGSALADEMGRLAAKGKILCVCGSGNNGGDGLVCARILKSAGREVDVVCLAQKRSHECETQYHKWLALGGETLSKIPDERYSGVVDCLFGTGFHGRAEGDAEGAILAINRLKEGGAKVLSADIPSGVNGENGVVEGVAVCADVTLCIGELKTGVLLADGIDCAGEIKCADIGIVLPRTDYAVLLEREGVRTFLPKRKRNAHKGSYGKAAIVAGSEEYTGAAFLSAVACLRSGAGYTTLFAPKDILPHYVLKAPEILLRSVCEGGRYAFNEEMMLPLLAYDAVAYGMGMGQSEEVYKGAVWLLQHYEGKLLLDADGLNSLAAYGDATTLLQSKKCEVVLTPHGKEFSRLCGLPTKEIAAGGVAFCQEYAKKTGTTLLLKGATTVVTNGEKRALNCAGNSGQAKAGSGDVLSGIILSLMAQGADTFEAACAGSFLAGTAAEVAAKTQGEYSLTATDVIACLGRAFLLVAEDADKEGGEE